MLKRAMLGAFSVINKKIKIVGMNMSFISSREARKSIFQIVASPLLKYVFLYHGVISLRERHPSLIFVFCLVCSACNVQFINRRGKRK